MKKYILLGSAPYVKNYWAKNKGYYLDNDYTVSTINNAWAIDPDNVDEWYHADDFHKYGTLTPSEEDLKKFKEIPMSNEMTEGCYEDRSKSTMIINVMHILFNRYKDTNEQLQLVVTGSDFVYSKNEQFFYGNTKPEKLNPAVQNKIGQVDKSLVGINADPLRFGTDWLAKELGKVKDKYQNKNYKLFVDTPLSKTLLPFEKFVYK